MLIMYMKAGRYYQPMEDVVRTRKDSTIDCIIQDNGDNSHNTEARECSVVDSARNLMALGLSAEDVEALAIPQPLLESISEYARLNLCGGPADTNRPATEAMITQQIQNLELESKMLGLRRKALKRRAEALSKLAAILQHGDSPTK